MTPQFTLLSETIVYQNPYFTILDRHLRLPNGKDHHFFIQKELDSCCVLAMTKDKRFVVVNEFRAGPKKMMLELPAGRLESEQDNPDERMRKELLEETGFSGELKKVGVMPTSPYSTKMIHCYYAVNCKKVGKQSLDHSEVIEVRLLSVPAMRKLLITGTSFSCAPGLLAWERMKKDGFL